MDTKYIETAKEVMAALGGIKAVAALTGRKYTAAANWPHLRNKQFPADTYLVMTDALRELGFSANPALWRQIPRQEPASAVSEVPWVEDTSSQ